MPRQMIDSVLYKGSRVMAGLLSKVISTLALMLGLVSYCHAVPDVSSARITDVTTSSFSIVWMTDAPANPGVEVYTDSAMTKRITDSLSVTAMPAGRNEIATAAIGKGILKVRVSGLSAATRYYAKAVTTDSSNSSNVGYSSLYEVVTSSLVSPYVYSGGTAQGFSNDLVDFHVHVRPSEGGNMPRLGDLLVMEGGQARYPISAFVGDGITAPEGLLDLNNIFGPDGVSFFVAGGDRVLLTVYRGEALSELKHYRIVPTNTGLGYALEPVKGFFADINLDGKVDEQDFAEFRKQYRSTPEDVHYNPDFDFVADPDGVIDAREFSKFAKEYGRTDVW